MHTPDPPLPPAIGPRPTAADIATATGDALARLHAALRRHQTLTIAVSGGVDSMTLAFVAHRLDGLDARMAHAVSPAVPPAATERVKAYADREGWRLDILDAGETRDPAYLANPVNRCYFCKTNLYDRLKKLSGDVIASGANLDDLGDYRPGLLAASERSVAHPFVEAGIDKRGVRALAGLHGLDDIEQLPAQPCLASRVETGIAIDADDLYFIDAVEQALRWRFGEKAVVRCRITRQGAVIEAEEKLLSQSGAIAALGGALCTERGRRFAGVRPYRRGSAFLHETQTHIDKSGRRA